MDKRENAKVSTPYSKSACSTLFHCHDKCETAFTDSGAAAVDVTKSEKYTK